MDSFLVFLIVGMLAGWLASKVIKNYRVGLLGSLVLGVLGAMLGGFILEFIGISSGGLVGTFISALVGAIVLLLVIQNLTKI